MLIYFFVLSFRLLIQHVSLFWGLDQNNTNNEGKEKKKKKKKRKKKVVCQRFETRSKQKHAQIFGVKSLSQATSRQIIYKEAMRLGVFKLE